MPISDRVAQDLNLAVRAVSEGYRRGFAQVIDPSRYAVLKSIVDSPGSRPIEVAERLDILPSSVTRHVRVLVDAGLVVTASHESDRRSSTLQATKAGQTALRKFDSIGMAVTQRVLAAWDQQDVETLTALLIRLAESWRDGAEARVFNDLGE